MNEWMDDEMNCAQDLSNVWLFSMYRLSKDVFIAYVPLNIIFYDIIIKVALTVFLCLQ